jgi:site-specific DNA-adenine methylase
MINISDYISGDKIVRPFINRLGGKYRQIKYLLNIFPKKTDIFVDVFYGSGCVTLNYHGANQYYANDGASEIIEINRAIKEDSKDEIKNYDWIKDKRTFEFNKKLYKQYLNDPKQRGDFKIPLDGLNLVYLSKYLNYYGVLGDG